MHKLDYLSKGLTVGFGFLILFCFGVDFLCFKDTENSKFLGMSVSLCQVLGVIFKNWINRLKVPVKAQNFYLL